MGDKEHGRTRLYRWGHLYRLLLRRLHDRGARRAFLQGFELLPLTLQIRQHLCHFGVEARQGIGRRFRRLRGFGLGCRIGGGLAHPGGPGGAVEVGHGEGPGFGHE